MHRPAPRRRDLVGEGRLADLASTEQGDHRKVLKPGLNFALEGALYH